MKIIDIVKNKTAKFTHYSDNELWFKVEDFSFPVPLKEVGPTTILAEDKAITFMRYIRKHLKLIEEERIKQTN